MILFFERLLDFVSGSFVWGSFIIAFCVEICFLDVRLEGRYSLLTVGECVDVFESVIFSSKAVSCMREEEFVPDEL